MGIQVPARGGAGGVQQMMDAINRLRRTAVDLTTAWR